MGGLDVSELALFVGATFAASFLAGSAGFAFGIIAAAVWLHFLTPGQSAALIVAFGLIASAVCALVGPIFVPFFIVPKLDWLFWSWFKAFIQYSFIPVIAFAFLMVFERFIFQYLTTLPAGITEDFYMVYGLQALVVVGVFSVGILLVPSLTNSIFSGRGGESVLPDRLRIFG